MHKVYVYYNSFDFARVSKASRKSASRDQKQNIELPGLKYGALIPQHKVVAGAPCEGGHFQGSSTRETVHLHIENRHRKRKREDFDEDSENNVPYSSDEECYEAWRLCMIEKLLVDSGVDNFDVVIGPTSPSVEASSEPSSSPDRSCDRCTSDGSYSSDGCAVSDDSDDSDDSDSDFQP